MARKAKRIVSVCAGLVALASIARFIDNSTLKSERYYRAEIWNLAEKGVKEGRVWMCPSQPQEEGSSERVHEFCFEKGSIVIGDSHPNGWDEGEDSYEIRKNFNYLGREGRYEYYHSPVADPRIVTLKLKKTGKFLGLSSSKKIYDAENTETRRFLRDFANSLK